MEYFPATDVAFRAYAERALARMPEPTADGLGLRLRRVYPHAQVEAGPDRWIARRDRDPDGIQTDEWWRVDGLPRARFDAFGLILEANPAAEELFGRALVGHHWHEFLTYATTDELTIMLEILSRVGAAETRFRIPRGDGTLLEFDSYTVVDGDVFSSVYRPVAPLPLPTAASLRNSPAVQEAPLDLAPELG